MQQCGASSTAHSRGRTSTREAVGVGAVGDRVPRRGRVDRQSREAGEHRCTRASWARLVTSGSRSSCGAARRRSTATELREASEHVSRPDARAGWPSWARPANMSPGSTPARLLNVRHALELRRPARRTGCTGRANMSPGPTPPSACTTPGARSLSAAQPGPCGRAGRPANRAGSEPGEMFAGLAQLGHRGTPPAEPRGGSERPSSAPQRAFDGVLRAK